MSGLPCGHLVPSMDKCDDALWFAAQVETSGEPITAAAVVNAFGRSEQRADLDAEMAEANIARDAEIASAIPGFLEALVDVGMLGKESRLLPAGGRADRPVPRQRRRSATESRASACRSLPRWN